MALTDLKSDLSKFRMPKKDPLVNKKRESVNKKQNQTPLGKFLETRPDINQTKKTPTKTSSEVSKMDNSSKFLGETNPSKVDNSSNFLGETDTSKMDNSSNFLGETTPTLSDKSSNFLGETDANKMDNSSNFLGETTPVVSDNSSNFLGETTPNIFSNSSNFLGETTPNIFSNSSNFLGETDPNGMNNSSNFLGETTPNIFSNSSNFLGETTPKSVDFFTDIHAKGFTSNFNNIDDTKFIGINPSLTIFDSTNSKFSNFSNNFQGLGFSVGYNEFKFGKFTGDTQRYNPDVNYFKNNKVSTDTISELVQSENNPAPFLDRMYDKFNLKRDSYNPTIPTLFPLILRGIQRNGLTNGTVQNYGVSNTSFDDGLIRGGIVTSTARALIDTARIGAWLISPKGILWSQKQVGLQRTNKSNKIWTPANLLTAVGSQHLGFKPNRSGLIPFNTPLKREGGPGQKLFKIYVEDGLSYLKGIRENLPLKGGGDLLGGFDSFYGIGLTVTTRYEDTFNNQEQKTAAKKAEYTQKFDPFINKKAKFPLSGIKPVDTYENSVPIDDSDLKQFGVVEDSRTNNNGIHSIGNDNPDIREDIQNQKLNPFKTDDVGKAYSPSDTGGSGNVKDGVSVPSMTDTDGRNDFGLASKDTDIKVLTQDNMGESLSSKTNTEQIKKYQTLSYGQIGEVIRDGNNSIGGDFRKKLDGDELGRANNRSSDYETRTGFQNSGKIGVNENRVDWFNIDPNNPNQQRYDKVNASPINTTSATPVTSENVENDLVHLWFKSGGKLVQFRGTVSGITDTFSPSWDSIKYNGRADAGYKYGSFNRTVSFNFQVVATSRIEMEPLWTKLQYLSTMTMPTYGQSDDGYTGNLLTFRLGSLYNNKLAFLNSLSYSMRDDMSWEISPSDNNPIGELPRGIDISVGLQILDGSRQILGSTSVYDGSIFSQ